MRRTPITGPDPAALSNRELVAAAALLSFLEADVAGVPHGTVITDDHLEALGQPRRFVIEALHTLVQICGADSEVRSIAHAATGELERMLGGGAGI